MSTRYWTDTQIALCMLRLRKQEARRAVMRSGRFPNESALRKFVQNSNYFKHWMRVGNIKFSQIEKIVN